VADVVSFHSVALNAEHNGDKQYYHRRRQHIEGPQPVAEGFDSLAFLHFDLPQLLPGLEFFQFEVFCFAGKRISYDLFFFLVSGVYECFQFIFKAGNFSVEFGDFIGGFGLGFILDLVNDGKGPPEVAARPD